MTTKSSRRGQGLRPNRKCSLIEAMSPVKSIERTMIYDHSRTQRCSQYSTWLAHSAMTITLHNMTQRRDSKKLMHLEHVVSRSTDRKVSMSGRLASGKSDRANSFQDSPPGQERIHFGGYRGYHDLQRA